MDNKRHPIIFDSSDGQELRINTINTYLKNRFGSKVVNCPLMEVSPVPTETEAKATADALSALQKVPMKLHQAPAI